MERKKVSASPPNGGYGFCRYCNGALAQRVLQIPVGTKIAGSVANFSNIVDGFFCTTCGLRYEFAPNSSDRKTDTKPILGTKVLDEKTPLLDFREGGEHPF